MKNIPKNYFEEASDNVELVFDEIQKEIEKDTMTNTGYDRSIQHSLSTLILYNIAHVADELHMLRAAIEKKERKAG